MISVPSFIEKRVEKYTEWVRSLERGMPVTKLVTDDADPLALLGRELENLSAQIATRETELRKLFELVRVAEGAILLDDVLIRIFDGFRGIIPFDRIGCAFLTDNGARLEAYWAKSELGPVQIDKGYSLAMSGSSLNEVLKTGAPRIINDLEEYLVQHPDSAATKLIVREGGRSSLTCPVAVDGFRVGFLFFTSRDKNAYGSAHQAAYAEIALQVSAVILKSKLYVELIDRNHRLMSEARELKALAYRDPLTLLHNRRSVDEQLATWFDTYQTRGKPFGVMMMDIDHFKRVNDTHGHACGDLVLIEFARRVSFLVRSSDIVGRYGGEEFVVLIVADDVEQLAGAAERIRRELCATKFKVDDIELDVTASIGAVHASCGVKLPAELLERADAALYAAKNGGRNRCEISR